ncbi:hypothetical protein [Micromonospora sp. HUAS LYJ1]|uniref:hypothetical protein n=1 Tax=Micromonospora sp. HUAS LYJ1 TaxID=3061626 RepID=UPI002671A445|nr:hypothetical protein [Micromonospora sp. HUAS LYJ1]WKU07993.1 hypothetical protein Q2K16_13670 [Micromonospora sp. HUAS LYJ1]
MTPHHLHARAALESLRLARQHLAVLARREAARNAWAEQLPAAPILHAPTYGTRHATGGHADPVSGRLAVEEPPARLVTWATRWEIADSRLNGIARMFGIPATHTLARIRHAIPTLLPATAAVLAQHLVDEDVLVRGWLDLPAYHEPLVGVACPHCGERQLVVQTAGPADAWTVICATGRPCTGTGCPCGMPGAVEGAPHIWPRALVLGAVAGVTR